MTWIPSIVVGGVILATGPIIIHLIFRRRFRVVEFAALQFLLESRKRTRHRTRIEELLLLLLRVLACCLMGLMLADVRTSSSLAIAKSAPTAHIFVLDDSLSMGQRVGEATVFRKAVAHMTRLLEDMPDRDQVAVIPASRSRAAVPLERVVQVADARREKLAARLSALKPTDLRADMAAALRTAAGLAKIPERMPVRLYLVSDFRRQDFAGKETADALRGAFADFAPENVEIHLLDFGLPCGNNLAIEGMAAGRNAVVAGVPTPIRVKIRNTGTEAAAATRLDVSVGEVTVPPLAVRELAAGEATEVEFPYAFDAPGSAAVRVSLPMDALTGDSVCAMALDVRESLRILIVDGSTNPADSESASFALAHALDPSGKGAFARRVDVQPAEACNPASFDLYDLVVLTNVREFPAARDEGGRTMYPALRALEEYVRGGGGLAIFAGDNVNPTFYNGPMYAEGAGLLPFPLADRPAPKPDVQKPAYLNPASISDSHMLRVFTGRNAMFSRRVQFYAHVGVQVPSVEHPPPGSPRVLASYDNGDPAVCRRGFGEGTVVLWCSSADAKWSNWPKSISFLPVMNDMAWELARLTRNEYTDVVGRGIRCVLSSRLTGAVSAALRTPAYPAEDVQILSFHSDGGPRAVSYPNAAQAGLYQLTFSLADRTEQKVFFSRSVDPRESDLTRMTESDVKAIVGRPCRYTANLAVETDVSDKTPTKAFGWIFAAALLAVLGLETFLAQYFGHYHARVRDIRSEPA
jgi:Mg-chelatase subunit ChlD